MKDRVVFPNATAYSDSVGSYWSLKNVDIHPNCIVLPESSEEVSTAISILSSGANIWQDKCQFAVRGGGHTPYAGAANIEQGVVIDLSNMPSLGLAPDHKTITVSPSQTWDQVFATLDVFDLATLGGRVGGVGVGGLTTGCGISYFSPRYGFTCDVVENFEVVLANGDIVDANATSHADLWKALRGGSNNYGIVTSITLKTFPQGQFWGGQTFHSAGTRKANFKALESLIASHPYDEYVHFINTLVITNMTRAWIVGNSLQYTKSDPPEPFPEVFKPFTDIQRIPIFPGGPDNTLRVDNHSDFTLEYAALSTYKKRWQFATISFGNSAVMMEEFFQLANQTVAPFVALPGFQVSIAYQPLPTIMSERRGAVDSLGPIQTEGNMFFIHWAMAVDGSEMDTDGPFQSAVRDLFAAATKKAKALGVQRDYLPLTYSDSWQDPIGSRSEGTIEEMWKTSKKYDPTQLFQKQVPGGFKLPQNY
ncbi:oxidoreductase [Viridothelium virens]|uniref:Oxidoreductase n=1 Tax=Viridothelium virens TaxID=1048519 RepID=A0A6A6GXW3_VIRVR|nr:oxidoreductase [Viridothelium virens]